MPRYIDADALIDDLMERYCKECNKRKGIKNGKYRIIYEIGEAPCRACEVDDVKAELEEAPTADVVEVVRCKDCKHREQYDCNHITLGGTKCGVTDDWFCADGERKETEGEISE